MPETRAPVCTLNVMSLRYSNPEQHLESWTSLGIWENGTSSIKILTLLGRQLKVSAMDHNYSERAENLKTVTT